MLDSQTGQNGYYQLQSFIKTAMAKQLHYPKAQFFHRPFDQCGFIPLPEVRAHSRHPTADRFVDVDSFQPDSFPYLQSQRQFDPFCKDCERDCFDDKLNQILLFKVCGQFSPRILSIRNVRVRLKQQQVIENLSTKFDVSTCQNNIKHLFRVKRSKGIKYKVLMVRQISRLVAHLHGDEHRDGELIAEIIRAEYSDICLEYFVDFVMEYPLMCPYCSQFVNKSEKRPHLISRIWYYLQQKRDIQSGPAQFSPFSVSPYITPLSQLMKSTKQYKKTNRNVLLPKISPNYCDYVKCQEDLYEPQYLLCLFVFKQNRYPLIKYSSQMGSLIHAVRSKLKDLQVRVCNRGTEHLWHRTRNERILMKGQLSHILAILHNGNATEEQILQEQGTGFYHRSYQQMKSVLSKQRGIYPFNIISNMKPYLNACVLCKKKKTQQQAPKSAIVFEQQEITVFMNRLKEDRLKNYKILQSQTSPKFKIIDYEELLSRSKPKQEVIAKYPRSLPAYVTSNPICQQSLSLLPSSVIEKVTESEHTFEVLQMLESFKQYPQVCQFFNNDVLWVNSISHTPSLGGKAQSRKFPSQIITDNLWVKKYELDEMYRVIFVNSAQMRQMYYKFGECLCVDHAPMMIKRRSSSGQHFDIAFLSGLDNGNNIVLFGIGFISENLTIYHEKLLEYFFESVGHRYPHTLVTNNYETLSKSVQLLKLKHPALYGSVKHSINWFYVLEQLKSETQLQFDRKKMLSKFCQLLSSSNPLSFSKRVEEVTAQMVDQSILGKFLQNKGKYCLHSLQPNFIGFAMETQRVVNLHQILSDHVIYQGKLASFFYYVFEIEKELLKANKADDCVHEALLKRMQLSQELVELLAKIAAKIRGPIFIKLMTACLESEELTFVESSNPVCENVVDKNRYRYHVQFVPEDDCWRCSCYWIYWTGLPCCHLIKVILKYNADIAYYINSRWLFQPE